jgi:hypothetical protein
MKKMYYNIGKYFGFFMWVDNTNLCNIYMVRIGTLSLPNS